MSRPTADQANEELDRLRDELVALKATLVERETALAKAALIEAARLEAAEERWRQQSASALAEVTARCEAAEALLAQLREEAARPRATADDPWLPKGAGRWSGFEQDSLAMANEHRESTIVLRPGPIGADALLGEERDAPRRRAMRGMFVAATLGVLAIAAYSAMALPENLWKRIYESDQQRAAPVAGSPASKTADAAQRFAIVVRDVNLRTSPSNTAAIVRTLPHGSKVATIEKRGNWMLVQSEDRPNIHRSEGWVYGSFLKTELATR